MDSKKTIEQLEREHWGITGRKGEAYAYVTSIADKKENVGYIKNGNMPEFSDEKSLDFWAFADKYEQVEQGNIDRKPRVFYEMKGLSFGSQMSRDEQIRTLNNFCEKNFEGQPYTAFLEEHDGKTTGRVIFSPRKADGISREPEDYFKKAADKRKDIGARKRAGTPKDTRWTQNNKIRGEMIVNWYKEVERTQGKEKDDLTQLKETLEDLRQGPGVTPRANNDREQQQQNERDKGSDREQQSQQQTFAEGKRSRSDYSQEREQEQVQRVSHELTSMDMEKRWGDMDIAMQEQLKREEAEYRQREEDRHRYRQSPHSDLLECMVNGIADGIDRAIRDTARKLEEKKQLRERQLIIEQMKLQAQVYVAGAKSPQDLAERCERVSKSFEDLDNRLQYMKGDMLKERLDVNQVITDYKKIGVAAKECPDKYERINFEGFRRDVPGAVEQNIANIRAFAHQQRQRMEQERARNPQGRYQDSYSRGR